MYWIKMKNLSVGKLAVLRTENKGTKEIQRGAKNKSFE
jgi:hypothetical protein